MKKLTLAAILSACSAFAFSQSVVTEPVGIKQKTIVKPNAISKPTVNAKQVSTQNSTARPATKRVQQPVVARKPVKITKTVKH